MMTAHRPYPGISIDYMRAALWCQRGLPPRDFDFDHAERRFAARPRCDWLLPFSDPMHGWVMAESWIVSSRPYDLRSVLVYYGVLGSYRVISCIE